MLFERWPESLPQKAHKGDLPVHVAARGGKGAMARFLFNMWRPAARAASNEGRLPLHEAAQVGDPDLALLLVDEWLDRFEASAAARGCSRCTCRHGTGSVELSKYFAAGWFGSVQERSCAGRLPMHEPARVGD
jgi:Ankyrin repeats (3 copies)